MNREKSTMLSIDVGVMEAFAATQAKVVQSIDPLTLSQDPASQTVLSELADTLELMSQSIRRTIADSDALKYLIKPVSFVLDVERSEKMYVHPCRGEIVMSPPEAGFTHDVFINADFFVVGPAKLTEAHWKGMERVEEVQIILKKSTSLSAPAQLTFFSGNRYTVSDGFSVRHCRNLYRTQKMTVE
eukprot:m.233037 g.233037  ORF g.233037 m.233037 type:complete len:186 (+) comp33632_c0_seq6:158-715(+)